MRDRYRIGDPLAAHFLTCTIVGCVPWEKRSPGRKRPRSCLDSLKYQHINKRITLYAYVIMENHIALHRDWPRLGETREGIQILYRARS